MTPLRIAIAILVTACTSALAQNSTTALKPSADPPPQDAHYAAAVQSVAMVQILIEGDRWREGTAFAVKAHPLFVTNYHVVAGQSVIPLHLHDHPYRSLTANLIAADPSRDLAAIRLTDPMLQPVGLELAPTEDWLKQSVEVSSIGYTSGKDPWGYLAGHIISLTNRADAKYRLLGRDDPLDFAMKRMVLVNMAPTPGHSGSPLLAKKDGAVVGMVTKAEFEHFQSEGKDVLAGGKTACIPYTEIAEFLTNLDRYKQLRDLPEPKNDKGLLSPQTERPAVKAPDKSKWITVFNSGRDEQEIRPEPFASYAFGDMGPLAADAPIPVNSSVKKIAPSLTTRSVDAQILNSNGYGVSFATVQKSTVEQVLYVRDALLRVSVEPPSGLHVRCDLFMGPYQGRSFGDVVVEYRRRFLRLFLIDHDVQPIENGYRVSRLENGVWYEQATGTGMVYRYRQYVTDDGRSWLALYVMTNNRFIACSFECPLSVVQSTDAEVRRRFDEAALVLLSLSVR